MDIHPSNDLYDSFVDYQSDLINLLNNFAEEFDFKSVDAGRSVMEVFSDLQNHIRDLLEDQQPIIDEIL